MLIVNFVVNLIPDDWFVLDGDTCVSGSLFFESSIIGVELSEIVASRTLDVDLER